LSGRQVDERRSNRPLTRKNRSPQPQQREGVGHEDDVRLRGDAEHRRDGIQRKQQAVLPIASSTTNSGVAARFPSRRLNSLPSSQADVLHVRVLVAMAKQEAYSEVGPGEMDHVLTSTDASNDLGQLDF